VSTVIGEGSESSSPEHIISRATASAKRAARSSKKSVVLKLQ
jgi:hypothetical protein